MIQINKGKKEGKDNKGYISKVGWMLWLNYKSIRILPHFIKLFTIVIMVFARVEVCRENVGRREVIEFM